MILTCPSCSTRYLSDPASLQPNGRMVRCANCGHSWFQKPPEDMPLSAAQDAPRVGGGASPARLAGAGAAAAGPQSGAGATTLGGAERFIPAADRRHKQGGGISGSAVAVVILTLIALGVVAAAFYQYRVEIVRSWPQTASVYNLVGLNVNTSGLVFRNITYERAIEDGLPVLTIHGQVVNVTDEALPIPRVRIGIRDENADELYYWTFALPQTRIGPGAATDFTEQMTSPPVGAHDLEVRFSEDRE